MTNAVSSAVSSSAMGWLDTKLIDLMPAAVYVCAAPSGLIVRYNQRAVELWGRAPQTGETGERFCGAHRLFWMDGTPLPRSDAPMAQVLASGEPVCDQEVIVERPDGSRIVALVNIDVIRDEHHNIIGAVNVLKDITERKRMEEESRRLIDKLRQERERLREAFERSPAFMAVLRGPDHVFESVNQRYCELLGDRAFVGKTVREAVPEIEDQGYLDILDHVFQTGEPFVGSDMRVMLRKAPQQELEERYIELIYEPLRSPSGKVTGILVHGVDLSERKKAQTQLAHIRQESERQRRLYETVLATIPDFVYVFDLDFRFTSANDALLKMWGKTWAESAGKNCLELGYPAWHAAKHDRELTEVLTTGRPVQDEVPFIGTHGLRIYDYIFVPVFGANGEIEAIAGTTRDVTERKQMEQELQRRAEELAEADRKKDEFIALLAHELRNPLAPVRNGLRILELAENDPQTMAQVRSMMERQLTHMVRLIDDLLDVSRMNRNKLHLQKGRVSLEEVINNAVEATRPAIEAAGHSLTLSLPEKPIFLDADLTRLAQVFSNLLSNSAKYTKPGGKIWLIAERHENQLTVEVRDNGIGIPAASLPNIFDMFSQVPSDSEHCMDGLGIGLALVKVLVDMHQGSVSASSDGPDKGSTFCVTLPILNTVADLQPEPRVKDIHASDQPKRRILIVDDNRDACDSMAMLLNLLGHDVRIAHDGFEALASVEAFAPHIVLMDVGMPNLNGYDATRLIREQANGKAITIVAVTGWGQEGDRTQSRAAGCDGHLVKPVNLKDIEDLLCDLKLREEKIQVFGETTL